MGSIYKKGQHWYIRFDVPRTLDGRRQQVAQACPGLSKKQAEQQLREIECQVARGTWQAPRQLQVGPFMDVWLSHICGGVEDSTFASYETIIRGHILPALGRYRLEKLTPLVLQRFYTELQAAGSNRSRRGEALSSKTIRNIHVLLHKALAHAVRWGLLTKNPADAVDLPRRIRPDTNALTAEDLRRLLGAIEHAGKWRVPLLIAIGTGMRRGEMLALQWQDYRPEQRQLVVRRALSHISAQHIVVKGTKTGRVRVVTLNDSLVTVLNHHRETMTHRQPEDWICGEEDGQFVNPHHLTIYFARLMRELGLKLTLHGLRHTHATALLAAGIPVKVISERLGHASVTLTQDI